MASIRKRRNKFNVVYYYTNDQGERKQKWGPSTYEANRGLIRNYINPIIGDELIQNINTMAADKFLTKLQKSPCAVPHRRRAGLFQASLQGKDARRGHDLRLRP